MDLPFGFLSNHPEGADLRNITLRLYPDCFRQEARIINALDIERPILIPPPAPGYDTSKLPKRELVMARDI